MDNQNHNGASEATPDSTDSDPIKQLLKRARELNKAPRSPAITPDSTGAKYNRALQTVRKYGIDV